ncbi:MAG: UDP-N-acetylglucosamine-peptide N-acetylglucosaminyltransferase, partial [Olpidium bornovanus]
IDPAIFLVWLRILHRVPHSILWLLKFPAAGEEHLRRTALEWGGDDVANRVIFTGAFVGARVRLCGVFVRSSPPRVRTLVLSIVPTRLASPDSFLILFYFIFDPDVAPKHIHITRGRVADIFLDTPECNAHTTAADILWSGTPIVTHARHLHKMCSRVAASIARTTGDDCAAQMVVASEKEYENRAVELASGLRWELEGGHESAGPPPGEHLGLPSPRVVRIRGPLAELRKSLFLSRDTSRLFDTPRWTRNLEKGLWEAWRRWEIGEEWGAFAAAGGRGGAGFRFGTEEACIWVADDDDGTSAQRYGRSARRPLRSASGGSGGGGNK